jgi:hypothetical protein
MTQLPTKNSKIAGCSWLFFGRRLGQNATVLRGRLVLLAVISLY